LIESGTIMDSTSGDAREERTVRLADHAMQENVVALTYSSDLLDELTGLCQTNRLFDVVVIDCTTAGFFFTADVLIQCAELAKSALEVQGAMVLVKSDKAVAVIKESVVGLLTFHVFEMLSQVYDYSPALARHIQLTLGNKADIPEEGGGDLSEQILMSSVPILTSFGIKLKAGMESTKRRNLVLAALDNYTPISSLTQKLAARMAFEEFLDELHSLEDSGAIYPLFAKIPFLVYCFRNHLPFKLKDYLVESRLISQDQVDAILFSMHGHHGHTHNHTQISGHTQGGNGTKDSERLSLGALCVSKGLISSRQLEIALQDQAFYGQGGETEKVKVLVDQDQDSKVHSLVGHLGTTEPAGVLQSLANNRESGVLSVEHKDMQFRCVYEQGRMTRAKQGKLKGNEAVVEFVSMWTEGIFVFLERQPPADLSHESCKVTRPIDKLLLDSALAQDNIQALFKKLAKGADTPLEKLNDSNSLFESGNLADPQENRPLSADDISNMQRLWKEFDGLASIRQTVKKLSTMTTAAACTAIARLLHYQLVSVPGMDLNAPLEKFQMIVFKVANHIGVERSNALLRLSLQASQGYSAKARMFQIGSGGEVGVDLTLARSAGLGLSSVLKQLEDWQVSYIEYVSQELDKNLLREIVSMVYKAANQRY
jgi:hypothetical protein